VLPGHRRGHGWPLRETTKAGEVTGRREEVGGKGPGGHIRFRPRTAGIGSKEHGPERVKGIRCDYPVSPARTIDPMAATWSLI
jgi:hypothetical protein